MKDFEAMKTGKSAIRPWLIFPYKENILLDLLSSMACVVSCPNRTKNLECYLTFKCVHPLACSRTKPAGKLRRLMPSFGCILAVRLKKYFFRNKTFLFFKIESWTFQVQFEIKIRETSQNFNSFSLFRQLLFSSFFIGCLIEFKFCKVSRNSISNWTCKFQPSILKNKKV